MSYTPSNANLLMKYMLSVVVPDMVAPGMRPNTEYTTRSTGQASTARSSAVFWPWWTAAEGPFNIGLGVVILALSWRLS